MRAVKAEDERRKYRAVGCAVRSPVATVSVGLALDETVEPDLPIEVGGVDGSTAVGIPLNERLNDGEDGVGVENDGDFLTMLQVEADEPSIEGPGLGDVETAAFSPSSRDEEEQEQEIPVAHIVNPEQRENGEQTDQDAVATAMQDEAATRRVLGETVVIAVEDTGERRKPNTITCFRMVLVVVILALVGAVGLAVAVTRRDGSSPSEATHSEPTPSPTSAAFRDCSPVVANAAPSTADALLKPGSPQRRALTWLVDEDGQDVNCSDADKFVQRFTLATLYYATGGENWIQNYSFLTDADECDWGANVSDKNSFRGSRCSAEDCVEHLILKKNNLVGTIPDEIYSLTRLTVLDLGTNFLSGTIQPLIGNLTTLREIYLQENEFRGHLPATLGNLIFITHLNLEDNRLSGFAPTSLGNLQSLSNLWLSQNDIKGADEKPDAGIDIFCGLGLQNFSADCLGSKFPPVPADVECGCCTICCSEGGDCLPPP